MPPLDWLRRLWLLYHAGKGSFPLRMGLSPRDWQALRRRLGEAETPLDGEALTRRRLMSELNATREEERQQLGAWLDAAGGRADGADYRRGFAGV